MKWFSLSFIYNFFVKNQKSRNPIIRWITTNYRSVLIESHDQFSKPKWEELLIRLDKGEKDLDMDFPFRMSDDLIVHSDFFKISPIPEINIKHANYCFLLVKGKTFYFFPYIRKRDSQKPNVRMPPFSVTFSSSESPFQVSWDMIGFQSDGIDLKPNDESTKINVFNGHTQMELTIGKKIRLPF